MSIASEIARISKNVEDSLDAVALKGVTVPSGSTSDDLPDLIAQITTGGGGGIVISDTTDAAGGTVRTITGVQISGTKQITQNGVEDVTSYAAVNVQVPTSGGTEFIVTLSYNSTSSKWEPDKTFVQIQTAYTAGKTIAVCTDQSSSDVSADGDYHDNGGGTSDVFEYWVRQYFTDNGISKMSEKSYYFTSTGITPQAMYEYLIPSGTKSISASGTIDVANYATASVSSGSATAPATITGSSATVSTGTNTLTLTKTVSVTPSVTAGYVSSGTAGNSSVSLTASVTTQAAQTIHPSTSDQTISSGRYLTGTQTVKAVTLSNLTAENIKSGVVVKVGDSTDDDCVTSVTGSYEGGGTSKNTQVVQGTTRTNSSSLTAIGGTLTVSKTGTYDIYYSTMRTNTSSSYTWATQLYIGGTAYGSENTTWTNNVQNVHLTNISLTANQTLRVYGRETRGTSYYVYAPMIAIVEQ